MTASEFIRQHPDLAPKALVEAGAAQGLRFTENLVRVVRHNARVGRGPSGGRGAARRPAAAPSGRSAAGRSSLSSGGTGAEAEFMRLVVEIGVGRAKILLGEVEQRLRALLARG